jgi:uncharacterized Zn finger protein (UPF0148 family)
MLVTTCPRCGKPTPARLASPNEIVCAACGYDGPPSPEAASTLLAAREFLLSRNARSRQLDEARSRALAQNAPLLFGALFVLATVPLTYEFATTFSTLRDWSGRNSTYGGAVLGALLFVGIWIFGIRSFFRVKRAQEDLRAACAALPPERKGDPARCRVCGGPLPASNAVIRCPFCATDNFFDPDVLNELDERQSHDTAEYEFAVARAESLTQSVTLSEQTRALVLAIVVPVVALLPMAILTQILLRIELPTNDHVRYELAMTREGECIERATTTPGFTLSELIGKKVHAHDGKHVFVGSVDRVYGSVLGNITVVVDQDGDRKRLDPRALCPLIAPPTISKTPTTVFAVDDGTVYFPDVGGIYSAPLRNPAAGSLDLELHDLVPVDMTTRGGALFFEDGSRLFRRDPSSAKAAFVAQISFGTMTLAASSPTPSSTIFAYTAQPPTLYAFDLGSASLNARKIDVPLQSIDAVASDGDDLFVAGKDAQGSAILHVHASLPPERWLGASCEAIAVDATSLVCGFQRSIFSYDRKGSAAHLLFELPPQTASPPESESIEAVAIDATNAYFSYDHTSTRASNGLVAKVPRAGGTAHVIAEGLPSVGSRIEVVADVVVTTTIGRTRAAGEGTMAVSAHKNETLTTLDTGPTSDDAIVVIAK